MYKRQTLPRLGSNNGKAPLLQSFPLRVKPRVPPIHTWVAPLDLSKLWCAKKGTRAKHMTLRWGSSARPLPCCASRIPSLYGLVTRALARVGPAGRPGGEPAAEPACAPSRAGWGVLGRDVGHGESCHARGPGVARGGCGRLAGARWAPLPTASVSPVRVGIRLPAASVEAGGGPPESCAAAGSSGRAGRMERRTCPAPGSSG